ncbi:MAG: hypothetical protein IT443_06155 [Phycisphaeraceae bacterium]|nr:hypothetical protein [Phycisphaeraceae bacterium]
MAHRIFNLAVLVSVIGLAITCALGLTAGRGHFDPVQHRLTLTDHFYVGIMNQPSVRLVFFNNSLGPYTGSTYYIGPAGQDDSAPQVAGFGDTWGIYYRLIRPSQESPDTTAWTLSISLAYFLVLFAILPCLWCWLRLALRSKPSSI